MRIDDVPLEMVDQDPDEGPITGCAKCDVCGALSDGEVIVSRDGFGFPTAIGFLCDTCRPWMLQSESDIIAEIEEE